ncbi:hypothetical protein PN836_000530 [Ningiella sp. W23]|uniref:hypothetical protein n=1 Tax=Ningiella sp. W23 TaxID=3023715 RepID=UPI003756DDD9
MKLVRLSKSALGIAALVGIAVSLSAHSQELYVPYSDINVEQIEVDNQHPSLFFTLDDLPAIRERSEALPWLKDTREQVKLKADAYMQISPTPYPLVNQFNGFGTAGRGLQNYVGTLGFASYLFNEPKYLEKAKELLLAVVMQTEPDNRSHWRAHLQVSDATQGMVLGYDFVYPILSKDERQLVKDEIYKFAKELTHHKSAWGMEAPGVLSCNHNTVHYGALGLATLALWNDDIAEKKEWMQRAIGRVDGYLASFIDADGYGTEGHHYYAYGLGGSSVFAWALARSNGPDLMAKNERIALAGDQVLWKLLPFEGRMLALNDNDEIPSDVAGMSGTLIYQKPNQLWAWLESVYQSGEKHLLAGFGRTTYTTPFLFMWGDEPLAPVHPKDSDTPLGKHFESGRVFLRSSWEGEGAAHFSMTSGIDFHRGHDHQDENSVTFFAYGEGFLIDPQYMPEQSEAHTTLKIQGAEQIKGGDGYIAKYREDEFGALVQGQAEHAYDFTKAYVGYADRKSYFVRGPVPYLVMRDDAQVEHDRAGEYVGRYITYPGNAIEKDGKSIIIKGQRGKASAKLMVFSNGIQVSVEEDDLKNQTFVRRRKALPYLDFLRRASVTVNEVNPKFLSILIPFTDAQPLPSVKVTFDEKADIYTARLSFETHTDVLQFNQFDGILTRSGAEE